MRLAEADLAATDADITEARAAFLPSIELTGSAGFESTVLKSLITSGASVYQIAAGATQPLLDETLPGQLDLAKGRYRENLFVYRKATVQSFVDVENALIAVRKTAEQVRLQEAAVKSAREAYDIAQAQLKEGAVDIVTVLNTQLTLFSAQDALVTARLARYPGGRLDVRGARRRLGGVRPGARRPAAACLQRSQVRGPMKRVIVLLLIVAGAASLAGVTGRRPPRSGRHPS